MEYKDAQSEFEEGLKAVANILPEAERRTFNHSIFEQRIAIEEPKEIAERKMFDAVQKRWPGCKSLCDYWWFVEQVAQYHPDVPPAAMTKADVVFAAIAEVLGVKLTPLELQAMVRDRM